MSKITSFDEPWDGLHDGDEIEAFIKERLKANEAFVGYYVCDTAANISTKEVPLANGYTLMPGGSIKVKMSDANTASSNVKLKIGLAEAKPLYYDGKEVDAGNTWEAGEVVDVYYDPTYNSGAGAFFANNVVGGGGEEACGVKVSDGGAQSDLDIVDENGNILVRFTNGHVRVKNFDSADNNESISAILKNVGIDDIPVFDEEENYEIGDTVRHNKLIYKFTSAHDAGEWDSSEVEEINLIEELGAHPVDVETLMSDSDLDISDEQGNILTTFSGGHVKTKYFDSSCIIEDNLSRDLRSAVDNVEFDAKIDIGDFSGWAIQDGVATVSSLGTQLKYGTATYEDVFDMSFDFICVGNSFELAFGKNDTSLAGTVMSVSTDNTLKVYKNGSTLRKTQNLSSISIVAGREYHISLKRRSQDTTIYIVAITDTYSGIKEEFTFISDSGSDLGYMWGQWCIYLKGGSSASVSNLSVCMEKDIQLMIIGHSFIEGNSIPGNKDKRYAAIIKDAIGKVYISGQGGASIGTFRTGTFVTEASFFPDCKYVFFNLGTNDGQSDTVIINGLTTLKQQALEHNITPIFATISPDLRGGTAQMHTNANDWIKQQDYFVDIATAFLNADGTPNTNAYLGDLVHPTIETHAKIANIFLAKYKTMFNYKK